MDDHSPKYSTADLIPLLSRSRQHIQVIARRHGIGVRISNRRYRFSEADLQRLQELLWPRSDGRRGAEKSGPVSH